MIKTQAYHFSDRAALGNVLDPRYATLRVKNLEVNQSDGRAVVTSVDHDLVPCRRDSYEL